MIGDEEEKEKVKKKHVERGKESEMKPVVRQAMAGETLFDRVSGGLLGGLWQVKLNV